MDFSRLSNPDAYKQALAGLLRRGGEVTDFIATAPEKAGQAILEGHEKNKALQAQAFANPNRPFQVTNKQPMTELGDRMLAGPLSVAPLGITAFHGTPHLFDKFDMSKVGTGEGAQAYGHGMYFAESPDVARGYADIDTKMAKTFLATNDNDILKAINDAEKQYDFVKQNFAPSSQTIERNQRTLDYLNNKLIKDQDIAGNLYKVDIPDAYIPTMMDYDKPLGQQSSVVKKALNNLKKQITPEMKMELGGDMNLLFGKDVTPVQLLNTLEIIHPTGGVGIGEKMLNELGVKGMRYLDNISRGQGKGTSNFVVFDPTDVKILERNNQPISRKELIQQQIDKIE